jgi:antitoxin ParD1/3/4
MRLQNLRLCAQGGIHVKVRSFFRRKTMNVKNSFTLSERSLRLAEKLVEDGQFPSIEKVLEAGIDSLLREEESSTHGDPLLGMKDEIRRRADLPRDQWLPWDRDEMANRIKARLDEKYKNR